MIKLDKEFFSDDTLKVAKQLLGSTITFNRSKGIIVETEAYKTDAASHYITRKNIGQVLAGSYGQVYIYLNYGMYHLLNITTEKDGIGAVLIRALEPISGIEQMKKRRKVENTLNLTNGPGKLCQALNIGMVKNGEIVGKSIMLYERSSTPEIQSSSRIGISKATDLQWRFYIRDNNFVSKNRGKNNREI